MTEYCHWQSEDGIWYIVGSPDVVRAGEEVEVETKDGYIHSVTIESLGRKIVGYDGEILQVGIPVPIDTSTRTITDRQKALIRKFASTHLDLYERLLAGRELSALTMDEGSQIIEKLLDADASQYQAES